MSINITEDGVSIQALDDTESFEINEDGVFIQTSNGKENFKLNTGLINGFVIDPVKREVTLRLDTTGEAGLIRFTEEDNEKFKAVLAKIEKKLREDWKSILNTEA